jgi:hypothetical protein
VARIWVWRPDLANNGLDPDPFSLSLISLVSLPFNHSEKGVKQKQKQKQKQSQSGTQFLYLYVLLFGEWPISFLLSHRLASNFLSLSAGQGS